MASAKLSALTAATGATTADLLYIVDGTDSKKITFDNLQKSITAIGTLTTDIVLPDSGYIYFGGATTDGSWRIHLSGTGLAFERRESGNWSEKGLVTA